MAKKAKKDSFLSLYEDKTVTREEYREELIKLVSPYPKLTDSFNPDKPLAGQNVRARINRACAEATKLTGFKPSAQWIANVTGLSANTINAYLASPSSKKHRELPLEAFAAIVDYCYWFTWELELVDSKGERERIFETEDHLLALAKVNKANDYLKYSSKGAYIKRQHIVCELLAIVDPDIWELVQEDKAKQSEKDKRDLAACYFSILSTLLSEEDLNYLLEAAKRACTSDNRLLDRIKLNKDIVGETEVARYIAYSYNLQRQAYPDPAAYTGLKDEEGNYMDITPEAYKRLLDYAIEARDVELMRRLFAAVNEDFYFANETSF